MSGRRLRLAVFTNQFPSRVNTFFARDLRSLIDAGFEVHVFPLYPLDSSLWRYVPDALSAQWLPRDRVHHLAPAGVLAGMGQWLDPGTWSTAAAICRSAAGFGARPLAKTMYAAAQAARWARRHRQPFDHILSYWGNYAATAAYLFRQMTAPAAPFSTYLHAGTDLYRDQVYLEEKLLAAHTIVMVCQFNRQFLRARYANSFERFEPHMHFHHLGLDLADYGPSAATAAIRPRVVGVGSFEPVKGFATLLEAFIAMRQRGTAAELRLIGAGSEGAAMRERAARSGYHDDIVFTGWLTPDEVKHEIGTATLLVHPSTGLGDAVPTVIKEAMALGTAVVASSVAGIPELLDQGQCGVLVNPGDPATLADAMAAIMADSLRRERVTGRARAFAEAHFDQQRNGARLADRLRAACLATV